MRQATCHPDKPNRGRGLCDVCYGRAYRRTKRGRARDRAAGQRWRESNRAYRKDKDLRRAYNISLEQYQTLLEAQGGVCAICKEPPKEKRLAVDHDHQCCPSLPNWKRKRTTRNVSCGGCIRGLLCDGCNHGLGKFKDNSTRLRNAVEYLDKNVRPIKRIQTAC